MRPVPLVLALSLVALPAPAVDPPPSLRGHGRGPPPQYLQIDTTNPPGNELKAALFYKEVLEREGHPGRDRRVRARPCQPPGHPQGLRRPPRLDPREPHGRGARRCRAAGGPPFSGAVKDGLIYGRGAEDMKAEGILQLVALIRRSAKGCPSIATSSSWPPRTRRWISRARCARSAPRLARPPEGPSTSSPKAARTCIGDDGRPLYFGVETAEKGAFWLRLTTTARPGHGSRPIADSALNRLVRALERVRLHRTEMKVLPAVERFFRDQAAALEGPRAEWYRDLRKALLDPEAARALYDDREASALLRNTISITVVKAGLQDQRDSGHRRGRAGRAPAARRGSPGVPGRAARGDRRSQVEIAPIGTFRAPNESPTDTELFRVIEATFWRHHPGVPVTTKMLTGATESVLFRPLGIVAMGSRPF